MKIARYLLTCGPLQGTRLVLVDIGAREALLKPWTELGDCVRIYGFEPDEGECHKLNSAQSHLPAPRRAEFFPVAIGKADEPRTFYITRDPNCSSLLEPNPKSAEGFFFHESMEVVRRATVNTITLDLWASNNAIKCVDFLKIDVQGAELEILLACPKVVDNVLGLQLEAEFISLYQGQPLFDDVNTWAREAGFILFDLPGVSCTRQNIVGDLKSRGQLIFADAFYLRDVDALLRLPESAAVNPAQLFKLAAIADLLGWPDYALYVLKKMSFFEFTDTSTNWRVAAEQAIQAVSAELPKAHGMLYRWAVKRLKPLISVQIWRRARIFYQRLRQMS